MGPIQIAYREMVTREASGQYTLDQQLGDQHHLVTAEVTVYPTIASVLEYYNIYSVRTSKYWYKIKLCALLFFIPSILVLLCLCLCLYDIHLFLWVVNICVSQIMSIYHLMLMLLQCCYGNKLQNYYTFAYTIPSPPPHKYFLLISTSSS